MKVRISDLPREGLTIKENLPLPPLNERMAHGRLGSEIAFSTPPLAVVVVTPTISGAQATGEISSNVKQACGRCSDLKERPVRAEFSFVLSYDPPPDEDEDFSDIGIIQIKDEHADLEEELYQSLIMEVNLFWSPEQDKKDNCLLCNKNFSHLREELQNRRTLGDILAKSLKPKK